VLEGAWRSEIATRLKSVGFSNVEAAFSAVKPPVGFTNTEGIYFPAQYSFAKGTSTESAIQSMIDRFAKEAEAVGLKPE
jgi:UPF0755 protein